METQLPNHLNNGTLVLSQLTANEIINTAGTTTGEFESFVTQFRPLWLDDLLTKLTTSAGKKSFLVFKGNKYVNVLTENIAVFHIKYESTTIICFDKQSYFVNYSLEQIQSLVSAKQFYRLNRQYLINFDAVKDVEHYFSRKLLVNSVIPTEEKLIVSKEKVSEFLHWLDNR
jgi:two-component system, LytTR family, response regulator LytT